MNGTALSSAVKGDENVWAMGSPTVTLWANSWNSASNGFTITMTPSGDDTNGYRINSAFAVDRSNANFSLYAPKKFIVDSCRGYWLASPSSFSNNSMIDVESVGMQITDTHYCSIKDRALRPVIRLPYSVVNQ